MLASSPFAADRAAAALAAEAAEAALAAEIAAACQIGARPQRARAVPPPSEAEVRRALIEFFARSGRVTACPPGFAASTSAALR